MKTYDRTWGRLEEGKLLCTTCLTGLHEFSLSHFHRQPLVVNLLFYYVSFQGPAIYENRRDIGLCGCDELSYFAELL